MKNIYGIHCILNVCCINTDYILCDQIGMVQFNSIHTRLYWLYVQKVEHHQIRYLWMCILFWGTKSGEKTGLRCTLLTCKVRSYYILLCRTVHYYIFVNILTNCSLLTMCSYNIHYSSGLRWRQHFALLIASVGHTELFKGYFKKINYN